MRFEHGEKHDSDTNLQNNLKMLLDAGRRLAAALPLYLESQSLHPMSRMASLGVIGSQVKHCFAALGGADEGQLDALRPLLSSAVRSINTAPNEATARAIYNAPKVQDALWSWASIEASRFMRNLTRGTSIDDDKLSDLTGEAVYNFVRETSQHQDKQKQHPFSLARSWEPARMPDALGTLRSYLLAWCKGVAKRYLLQQEKEGVSLDAPISEEYQDSIKDAMEDRTTPSPEATLLSKNDYQAQTQAMSTAFARQLAALQSDITSLENRNDAYSNSQRHLLKNRSDAIKEMVGPLLSKLREKAKALSAVEADKTMNPSERGRNISELRRQFDSTMRDLTAISEAQERAYGEPKQDNAAGIQSFLTAPKNTHPANRNKKLNADPLSTARVYSKARANAGLLLPYIYRSLSHRKNSDLSQRFTAGLLTNWKILEGINSQDDLSRALSPDTRTRATANDRSLFNTTTLKIMMQLRDLYTHDEKFSVARGSDEEIPKSAKQRFIALFGKEIETDSVLRSRAPQIIGMLNGFVSGWSFRALWENVDHYSRVAAYEWARNERINKRWSDLSPEEVNKVADEAGKLIYDNAHRSFAAWSQSDPQRRVTHDLDLSSQERQQIMREEAARITQLMRGEARGTWAHGEPADSSRFHDKLRAKVPQPTTNQSETQAPPLGINGAGVVTSSVLQSWSDMASLLSTKTRRFAACPASYSSL